jgi:hypothetical protein
VNVLELLTALENRYVERFAEAAPGRANEVRPPPVLIRWNDAVAEPLAVDLVTDVQTGVRYVQVTVETGHVVGDHLLSNAELAELAELAEETP